MEKSTRIFQQILNLTCKHTQLAVPADIWEELVFHNPWKGEHRDTEIEKWREKILTVYEIMSRVDHVTGWWYFKHKDRDLYLKTLKEAKS